MQWNNAGPPAAHFKDVFPGQPASWRRELQKTPGSKNPVSAHVSPDFEEQLRWEKDPAHPHQLGLPDSIRPTPGHRFGVPRPPCSEEAVVISALGLLALVLGLLLPLAHFRCPFSGRLTDFGSSHPLAFRRKAGMYIACNTAQELLDWPSARLIFDGSHRQVRHCSIQCTQ